MEKNQIEIYPMEQNNLILLAPKYILIDVADEDLETVIKNLAEDKTYLNQLDMESVIPISTLYQIESNKKTRDIVAVYEVGDDFEGKRLVMKDGETRDRFFKDIRSYLSDKYSYEVKEFTPLKAALSPLSKMAYTLLIGGVLTWIAHASRTQSLIKRTTIVKGYLAMFYDIAIRVGPIPVAVVTFLVLCWFFQYVIKSYKNPPINMTIKKEEF